MLNLGLKVRGLIEMKRAIQIFEQSWVYHHYQEYPLFKFHWRWKEYKGTFEVALILFGHWFGIVIDYSK